MNFVVLYLCVSFSGVLSEYLNKKEGDDCEWEGLKGRCVKETRCLTTLDDDSPKHAVCSNRLGQKIICCTDCNLVNSTKNVIFIPPSGLFWKNGQKARDNCLQYLYELPYKCNEDGFYAGISRELDEDNGCYSYSEWDVESSSDDRKPRAEHPYLAMLGYGDDFESALWTNGGFIISDKYIMSHAKVQFSRSFTKELKFIVLGLSNRSDATSGQTHLVKRIIIHPQYYTNKPTLSSDIALIETATKIKFNENALPACLHVAEDAAVEDAITTTWEDLHSYPLTDTIQTVKFEKFSEQKCKASYYENNLDYDHTVQMCYGSKVKKTNIPEICEDSRGQPLMITTQFSSCVHTAIGVLSRYDGCRRDANTPYLFTRISHYVPWIESIVWPEES